MTADLLEAPFSADQVRALSLRQADDRFHPYTCSYGGQKSHQGNPVLLPTRAGMVCRGCGYIQTWVHRLDTLPDPY